jgi:hypothetical protein
METHHERLTTDLQFSRELKEDVRVHTACACSHRVLEAHGQPVLLWLECLCDLRELQHEAAARELLAGFTPNVTRQISTKICCHFPTVITTA